MIKSIVLLATLLAVVVAHPQGLWGMAENDPVLEDLFDQATRLYRSGPKGSQVFTFSRPQSARSTHLKDRVQFDMEVKVEECKGCSCTEEYNNVHVTCLSRRGTTGYQLTFLETPAKETKQYKRC